MRHGQSRKGASAAAADAVVAAAIAAAVVVAAGTSTTATSAADVEKSRAGKVDSVRVMRDMATGRARGFAFVEMGTDEEAQKAISEFHEQQMDGRALVVNEARPKPEGGFGGGGGRGGGGYRGGGGGGGGRSFDDGDFSGGRRKEPRW